MKKVKEKVELKERNAMKKLKIESESKNLQKESERANLIIYCKKVKVEL